MGLKVQEDASDGNKIKTILDGGIVKVQTYYECAGGAGISVTFSGITHCDGQPAWPSDPNRTFNNFIFGGVSEYGYTGACGYYCTNGDWRCFFSWHPVEKKVRILIRANVYPPLYWVFIKPFSDSGDDSNPLPNQLGIGDCSSSYRGYGGEAAWTIPGGW